MEEEREKIEKERRLGIIDAVFIRKGRIYYMRYITKSNEIKDIQIQAATKEKIGRFNHFNDKIEIYSYEDYWDSPIGFYPQKEHKALKEFIDEYNNIFLLAFSNDEDYFILSSEIDTWLYSTKLDKIMRVSGYADEDVVSIFGDKFASSVPEEQLSYIINAKNALRSGNMGIMLDAETYTLFNDNLIYYHTRNNYISIYDTHNDEEKKLESSAGWTENIRAVETESGKYILASNTYNEVSAWNFDTLKIIGSFAPSDNLLEFFNPLNFASKLELGERDYDKLILQFRPSEESIKKKREDTRRLISRNTNLNRNIVNIITKFVV